MTPVSHRPDLGRIGESAFAEVLATLLSLPVAPRESSCPKSPADTPDLIVATVLLTGRALSGSVQIRLPLAFVEHAVKLLTGHYALGENANAVVDDAAGELANMVAGRVALQLAALSYPCSLGTPSVSRSASWPVETESAADHGRTDLMCNGHCLSLEIQCRYTAQ